MQDFGAGVDEDMDLPTSSFDGAVKVFCDFDVRHML
jgi:hypothetical protein